MIGVQEDLAKKLLLQGCSPDQLATFRLAPLSSTSSPGTRNQRRS